MSAGESFQHSNLVEQLPARLKDLLRREICVALSQQRIKRALAQVEAKAKELKLTRAPFMFLQPKAMRTNFTNNLEGAEQTQAMLEEGLVKIEAVLPRLRVWAEDELETFMRATQKAYVRSLAGHRFAQDWERLILRFEHRVNLLVRGLGVVRVALGTMPGGAEIKSMTKVYDQLTQARQAAVLVDLEFVFLNRLADEQRLMSGVGQETFRRIVAPGCEQKMAGLLDAVDAGTTRLRIEEFLVPFQELARLTLVQLREEAGLVKSGDTAATESFATPTWEAYRQLLMLELDVEQMEAVVADTERLMAAG